LNTSDVTADGLRIAAELSTGTTALLRVALSHGLLNVLSAGPLLAGIAASCSAGSTGPRAAADIATLTLLLVDDSSPTQLTDVITTVRAWGEIGVAFHEHTVDDAVILSTGQPPTGRPMLVHGVPLIPAPGGSLPLTLSAMVVALHTGADRQQAAAAAVDAQALEAGTTWFDAALTVTACRRLQLLSVARDVLVATVPHDADRILHLLADHHALPNATTEQFTVRLCAVTDAVTAGASDTQARDLLALLDAVGDSAGADDVAAILDTWL
ncbi:MAG: hypothetical protein QG661_3187, partial [Actinomycetota bacterium]|nr:hypothetical protein [Actinomycetota bacterium]